MADFFNWIDKLLGFATLCFFSVGFAFMIVWCLSRLTAERCPQCNSKFKTYILGDWDGQEEWKCETCQIVFYKKL